ncbi:hypothetical protein HPB50_004992 [Hyalomma asiaticum]|uniref:Uncharacterized protein n=1 Tax=Hyalomma asiaticum TaxID=266040 RepID=A0ACB7RHD1_HYAAI|nr:hypothetical protein HPB50_004992 [Hyalomma asiaticum]
MASRPSFLRDIEREFPCVDLGRLAGSIESIYVKFSACGVELGRPCCKVTDIANRCWITCHLPALNQSMRAGSMHIFEHVHGKFTLSSFPDRYTEYDRAESNLLESFTLVYWLLKEHRCATRLHLDDAALLFCCFPSLLSKALLQNKGLEQVQFRPEDAKGRWRRTRAMDMLSSTLGKLSPILDVLEINALVRTEESFGGIAAAVRGGSRRRLGIWNCASSKIARKLFRAVRYSSCLCELEVGDIRKLSLTSAEIISEALCRNKTLRKFSIEWLGKRAIGMLLSPLKTNTTLQELIFTYSYDQPSPYFWNSFEAIKANRTLKCIKLVAAHLMDNCAFVIADILRDNNVIEEVCLPHNIISDVGAFWLARALRLNSTLKRLDISNCALSYEVLPSFVDALALNSTVECVRLGEIDVPESWTPSLPLTANICARLDVTWNTRGLEDWGKSIRQGHHFPRVCVGWTADTEPSAIVEWFDAVRENEVSIRELTVSAPGGVAQDFGDAVMSFLENTCTLKKLTTVLGESSHNFETAIMRGLARNKSVTEVRFHYDDMIHHV